MKKVEFRINKKSFTNVVDFIWKNDGKRILTHFAGSVLFDDDRTKSHYDNSKGLYYSLPVVSSEEYHKHLIIMKDKDLFYQDLLDT